MFFLAEKFFANVIVARAAVMRRRFEEKTKRLRKTQEEVLLSKIRRNEDSSFGRDHGFSTIRSISDFRSRLPVSRYDHFAPYIDKVKEGDISSLFGPAEKVHMFALTSGTQTQPKYIPLTTSFVKEYRRGWLIWGSYAFRDHWEAFSHKFLHVVSSHRETETSQGIPCGSISGLVAETQEYVVRDRYAVPKEVNLLENNARKQYLLLRVGLVRRISFFTTANPSTMLRLAELAESRKEDLIQDVRDGTCEGKVHLEDHLEKPLRPFLRRNPKRAKALERILERAGRFRLADIWPDLALLGTWKGGPLSAYVKRFPEYFDGIPVRDIGLLASEGRMTIPQDDGPGTGVLDVESQFFEFIPEEEIEESNPTVLLPWELEEGRNYFIIPTTSAGLYRYNISDVVRVVSHFNETPVVEFMNKGSHFSNITGEKISEFQVVHAMNQALKEVRLAIDTFAFCLCLDTVPFYSVAVEAKCAGTVEVQKRLLRDLEENLNSINIEYHGKRISGRLGPLRMVLLETGSFQNYCQRHLQKHGGWVEQYKHRYLVSDPEYLKEFRVIGEVRQE